MKQGVVLQIGERIRKLRLAAREPRLTQEKLAERAKISVSFLSMIERGERSAHVETLAKLAEALGIPLTELFEEQRAERRRARGLEAALEPLADFIRRERLSRRDVERLLVVARALFDRRR
jgi:transcriptional regulator with XRE-family HTH domain